MDLIAACRAFVSAAENGSVTLGAASIRVPQSVASRRIQALEAHLGAPLLDRGSRRAAPTRLGRVLLPSARELVRSAEAFESDAEVARSEPVLLEVPATCGVFDLARLVAAARSRGIPLETRRAAAGIRGARGPVPIGTAEIVRVPEAEATWIVPLGAAVASRPRGEAFYVDTLRRARRAASGTGGGSPAPAPRIWLEPDDAASWIGERLTRLGESLGLAPGQIVVARSIETAAASVMTSGDVLLASARQADELDLYWQPLAETDLARGYAVRAETAVDAARLRSTLDAEIARALGVPE